MSRRIWIAEGYASDGDVYGRALHMPDGSTRGQAVASSPGGRHAVGDIQRASATILRTSLGDIPTCPCLDAPVPQHDKAAEPWSL